MNRLTVHQDLAVVGRDRAGQRLDQCRFARTVVADHRQDLAGVELEVRLVQSRDAAEPFGKSAGLQDGRAVRHAETLRSHWSIETATMIRKPTANSCHSTSTPESARPLRNTPTISAPISVPMIEPRPPNRLVPPITTAVMESRFAV